MELMQVEPPLVGEITQVQMLYPGSVVPLAMFRFNVEKYVPTGPMNTSKVAQRWSFQPGLILPKARKEAVEDHYLIRCVYFMFIVILLLSLSNIAALTAPAVQMI